MQIKKYPEELHILNSLSTSLPPWEYNIFEPNKMTLRSKYALTEQQSREFTKAIAYSKEKTTEIDSLCSQHLKI